ncbi:MAG: NADH-quinone oxidoreductase subunit M [Methylococcaceae bacterium]|nr:NADH-quinone oxidoreductase subunit M [Methylococcaceae bacterium]
MSESAFPLLSLIIALPLMGAVLIGACHHIRLAKTIALSIALLELIPTLLAVRWFDATNDSFQLVERHTWIPSLNIEFLVGIDGISVLFLPMTAVVTVMAILSCWNSISHLSRFHFALLLALESVTMGVFSALDLVLFFLFWELTLPLIFFLIGLWGVGPRRRSAATKYTLFMLVGGVPILFAIVMLAINHVNVVVGIIPKDLSFSFPELLATPLPENLQGLVFILLLTGFAIKAPLIPFHTWLPTVAMEGSPQITAVLVGLKLGVYGILRFAMPLSPSAAVEYSWAMGIVGAITLIYCALIALQQTNLRRLLAYASVSHVGLVIIGLASLNIQGLQGAILSLFNFTLIASSLMLVAGFIQHRLGSTEIIHLGGLAKVMPHLTVFYFILTFASIGVPGTIGFPAELLLIIGAMLAHPSLAITALAGSVLGAAYILSFSRRAFLGPIHHIAVMKVQDLRLRERLVLCLPLALILLFGFFPNRLLNINQKSAEAWLTRLLDQPAMENREMARLTEAP